MLGASTAGALSAFVLTTGQKCNAASQFHITESAALSENRAPNEQQPSKQTEKPCYRLWNPLTGRCRSVMDIACDLQEVRSMHCNYANLQSSMFPGEWGILLERQRRT